MTLSFQRQNQGVAGASLDAWAKAFPSTIILLFTLCDPQALADVSGRVVAVTDGDTIKVLDATNVQHKIRQTGIDTPEQDQPLGNASRRHLASLVAGTQVKVEPSRCDRYGRLLGKFWVDGTDTGLEQVKSGYAWWYRYYAKQQPKADREAYEVAENVVR